MALAIYANSLNNPFHFDDIYLIVKNTKVFELKNALDFFTSPILTDSGGFSGYRPLVMASYSVNYHFSGLNPAPYRALNLIFHIMNAVLLFILLGRLFPSLLSARFKEAAVPLALAASSIFLLHPINTVAINFIWKRTTLMCSFFMLLAMVHYVCFHLKLYPRNNVLVKRVVSLLIINAFLILGILSKEEAVILPVAIALIFFATGLKKHFKVFSLEMIPSLLIVAGYSLFRIKYFGTLLKSLNFRAYPITPAPDMPHYLMSQMEAITRYLGLLLFPHGLSIFHEVDIPPSVYQLSLILRVVMLFSLIVLAVAVHKRHRWLTFSVFWFFIFLIPTSFTVPLNILMDEIRVYLPQVGFAISVSIFMFYVYSFFEKRRGGKAARRIVVSFFILLIVLTSSNTFIRNSFYKNEYLAWLDAIDKAPNSILPRLYLGNLLREAGRYDKAKEQFEKAVLIDPESLIAKNYLGLIYQAMKENDKAIKIYDEVLKKNSGDYYSNQNMGILYSRMEQYDKAMYYLKRATEINGYGYAAYMELGKVYMFEKNKELALNYLHKAYALNRYDFLTSRNLALLYFDLMEKPQKGIEYARVSLALEPRQPDLREKIKSFSK